MSFKENCGFKKLGLCNFKKEDCKPKAINDTKDNPDTNIFCDLYDIKFTSKDVREHLKMLKKKLREESKNKITKKKLKEIVKLEKDNKLNNDVLEYKKFLTKLEDYGQGVKILEKAYRHLKRTKK